MAKKAVPRTVKAPAKKASSFSFRAAVKATKKTAAKKTVSAKKTAAAKKASC